MMHIRGGDLRGPFPGVATPTPGNGFLNTGTGES